MASRTTALFSFEGTNLALVRRFGVRLTASSFSKGHYCCSLQSRQAFSRKSPARSRSARPKCTTVHEATRDEELGGEFLENCIEKNFHVSQNTHESGHQTF